MEDGAGDTERNTSQPRLHQKSWVWQYFLIPTAYSLFTLLFLLAGYQTFHFYAEAGSILVGLMAMITASISYRFLHNSFLLILSLGLGWCAMFDLVHASVFQGMNLLPVRDQESDLASQLWVIARFLQASTFLLAVCLMNRAFRPLAINIVFALYSLLAASWLISGNFPDTFLQDTGLTTFKIYAEYLIITIFVAAGILLLRRRSEVPSNIYLEIQLAIAAMLLAELCFTAYLSVNDFFNAAGHILKIFAYWFVFRVLVLATVEKPFREREKLILDLRERVKELRMLYELFKDSDVSGVGQRQLLEKTVELLPKAFLHKEYAKAAVESQWGNFGDPASMDRERKIEKKVYSENQKLTRLVVGYPATSPISEPIFLEEEYALMDMVAARIKDVLDRISNNQRIDTLSRLYMMLSATNRIIVQSRDKSELFESLFKVLQDSDIFPAAFLAGFSIENKEDACSILLQEGMDEDLLAELKGMLGTFSTSGQLASLDKNNSLIFISGNSEAGLEADTLLLHSGFRYLVLMTLHRSESSTDLLGLFVDAEEHLTDEYRNLLLEMQSDLEFALQGFSEINKRLRAEREVQDSEERFRTIFDRSPAPMVLVGAREGGEDIINQAFEDWSGIPKDRRLSPMYIFDNYVVDPEQVEKVKQEWLSALEQSRDSTQPIQLQEIRFRRSDGEILHASARITRVGETVLLALNDLTEIRKQEQKLRESESRFRAMIEEVSLPVSICRDGFFIYANPYLNHLLGIQEGELAGHKLSDYYQMLDNGESTGQGWAPAPGEISVSHDVRVKAVSGEEYILNMKVSNINWDGGIACISIGEDVTERRRVEKELNRSHKLLKELSKQIPGVIYQFQLFPDGTSRFPFASEQIRDIYEVTPEEVSEDASKVFSRLHPRDREKVEASIRESASKLSIWRDDYRVVLPKKGVRWRSGFAKPQKLKDGSILWHGFIEDSTQRINYQRKISRYNRELEQSMKGTLEVLARMVDLRDPYTAGHERRVALIAAAIARAIGMTEREVETLQLAGMVHDIGKIAVPAEILSKPSKISESEYELIKSHAQAGYEILKDVPLHPVIREAIWQHHERLDGSGYPRGLKGDAIIREARILAVADVLESMISHRPYRPALGVEAALQELHDKAGICYDQQFVEVATRLIKEEDLDLKVLWPGQAF